MWRGTKEFLRQLTHLWFISQPSPKPSSQLMTRKQYVDPFASDEDDSQNPSPEKPSTTSAKTPERDQPLEDTYDVVTKRYSNTPSVPVR